MRVGPAQPMTARRLSPRVVDSRGFGLGKYGKNDNLRNETVQLQEQVEDSCLTCNVML